MKRKLKVLTVEDSEDDALLIAREFKKGGILAEFSRVDTQESLESALGAEDWDIVLCDYSMPHLSGVDALQIIKGTNPDVPVILVSGTIGEERAVEAMRAGASDYLMKSHLKRLVPAVERELRDTVVRQARKRAEDAQRRLNRELRAISRCSQAMVRANDERTLLDDICHIVCDEAGYRMAWVGYAENDDARTVRVAAWAGDDGGLSVAAVTWLDSVRGRGPTGTAIRTGQTSCVQDVETDARLGAWREDALQRGYRSCLSLPLKDGSGHTFGALSIYSAEPDAFSADEVRLLEELASDLAFGISVLRARAERLQAEEALRKLSRAVEQSQVSIVITDITGRIEYVNPKFAELTGYTRAEVLGQTPRLLKSGDRSPQEYERLWQTITSGRVWSGEFHNRKKNGELYWESACISPILDAAGGITHFVAVKEDITDRKRLEEQLRQAQKLEAIGQLAGGVAHDFNNILAAMLMHLGLMQCEPDIAPALRAGLDDLKKEAGRAAKLTRQLLLFSRRQMLDAKAIDLSEIVGNMTRMLRRLIGENIDLSLRGSSTGAWLKADAGMMDQLLLNLCVNARDAMPHGGELAIGIHRVDVDSELAGSRGVEPGAYVCLSVTDTGCGMDAGTLKHMFEPFFTTKAPGRGTGLGLATVYGIVKEHRGWIDVESQPEKGTTFRVFLPALPESTVGLARAEPADIVGGTETILLVEDDLSLRHLTALGLRKLGYVVVEASDGAEAVAMWVRSHEDIDVLLTDMVMPGGITGVDLAERFRREKSALHVIVVSGYTADAAKPEALQRRGMAFLAKPYELVELARLIRASLDQPSRLGL